MSSDYDGFRQKKDIPAALRAAQVRFKPGHPGREICTATTRQGKRCGHLAAHGMATCYVHHAGTRARLLKLGRPRCAAWRIKRPQAQCGQLCAPGRDLCYAHVAAEAQGTLVLTPTGQRERYTHAHDARYAHAAPLKRTSPRLAHAAPRELRALPVWRMCSGQRERAALVEAWVQRGEHPEAWRAIVRRVTGQGAR